MICEFGPDIFWLFLQFVYSLFFDTFADLVSGVGFVKNCCFWLMFVLFPIIFVFFSESNGREYILEM